MRGLAPHGRPAAGLQEISKINICLLFQPPFKIHMRRSGPVFQLKGPRDPGWPLASYDEEREGGGRRRRRVGGGGRRIKPAFSYRRLRSSVDRSQRGAGGRKPRVESAPLITNNVKTSDKIKRRVFLFFPLKVQNSTSESLFIQSFILSLWRREGSSFLLPWCLFSSALHPDAGKRKELTRLQAFIPQSAFLLAVTMEKWIPALFQFSCRRIRERIHDARPQ